MTQRTESAGARASGRVLVDDWDLVAFASLFVGLFVAELFGLELPHRVGEPLMLVLVAASVGLRRWHAARPSEVRFWRVVGAAQLVYLAALSSMPAWGSGGPNRWLVLEDCLHLGYYALYLYALLLQPDRPRPRGRRSYVQNVDLLASLLAVVTLMAYFVGVAVSEGILADESFTPHIFLYALFDLCIAATFLALARSPRGPAWSRPFLWLGIAAAIWVGLDLLEAWSWRDGGNAASPQLPIFPWFLPHLGTLLAARSRRRSLRETRRSTSSIEAVRANEGRSPVSALFFLAFLPLMHLGLYATGLLSQEARAARESLLLLTLPGMAWLAWVARRRRDRERSELEGQLQRAQTMEAIGRLSGGMAHDFNNLLTVIMGNAEALRAQLRVEGVATDEVDGVLAASTRGRELTRQLLALGRSLPTDVRVHRVREILEGSHRMMGRLLPETIRVEVDAVDADVCVRVNRSQIEQVLLNLAINARDAMPDGGRLRFSCGTSTSPPRRTIGGSAEVDRISIRVEDTGTGMDEETLQRSLDPFFTTKASGRGSGMGLTMAYGLVRQNGGALTIESTPGVGTRVELDLPSGPVEDCEELVPRPRPARTSSGQTTILLVEDEPGVRHIVQRLLERMGHRVIAAEDAESARERFAEHRDEIVLLLTDVIMPGDSGIQLYRQLVSEAPDLKVLLMSGYSPRELGGDQPELDLPLLSKPFTEDTLRRRLGEVLRGVKGGTVSTFNPLTDSQQISDLELRPARRARLEEDRAKEREH